MCAPRLSFTSPRRRLLQLRQNDTGEITSVPIRASQAEICYWAPYSLCGTKAKQKVSKRLQVRTDPSAPLPSGHGRLVPLCKERTSRAAIPLHRPAERCLRPGRSATCPWSHPRKPWSTHSYRMR
ncbi:hypothetical protein D7231_32525 [Streptomyces klenkii]|uniref:Uncharacterized protein n=1 Tax=Streptomyces klenkii TaxID=1420899 RepID=A0A3B0AQ53_9ACTN|nr:hypothetical protein D7231_32525 [Streptomyces klenkii]